MKNKTPSAREALERIQSTFYFYSEWETSSGGADEYFETIKTALEQAEKYKAALEYIANYDYQYGQRVQHLKQYAEQAIKEATNDE
jgi:hypothetical protein